MKDQIKLSKEVRVQHCPLCGSKMIGHSVDDDDDSVNKVNWICSRSPDCRGFIGWSNKKTHKSYNVTKAGKTTKKF